MHLDMPAELAVPYKSGSQRTRVVSEAWAEDNLYCVGCNSNHLRRLPSNTPALDFECQRCTSLYQLKSQRHRFTSRINDAAYEKMREAILKRRTPNILALHYIHISYLNPAWEPSDVRHHLYSCGYERDEDALEVETQWVRNKTSPFSSLLMPR